MKGKTSNTSHHNLVYIKKMQHVVVALLVLVIVVLLITLFARAANTDLEVKSSVTDSIALVEVDNIAVSGDYAYVVSGSQNTLASIDISDLDNLTIADSITGDMLAGASGIAIHENHVFVSADDPAMMDDVLAIYDITDPASITLSNSLSDVSLAGAADVVVDSSGTYAYVSANAFDTIAVVDISSLAMPLSVNETFFDFGTTDGTENLVLDEANDRLYSLGNGSSSLGTAPVLGVVNIADPLNLSGAGSLQDAVFNDVEDLVQVGDYLLALSSGGDKVLATIDVMSEGGLSIVNSFTDMSLDGGTSMAVSDDGDYAYITVPSEDRVIVLDITDPTSPVLVDTITTGLDDPRQVVFSDDNVYVVSNGNDTLSVIGFEVESGSSPSPVVRSSKSGRSSRRARMINRSLRANYNVTQTDHLR